MPRTCWIPFLSLFLLIPLPGLMPQPAIGQAQVFESDGLAMRFMKRVHQRNSNQVLAAFHPVVSKVRHATVELKRAGERVAMGGIVDANGLIVTKASLLYAGEDDSPLVVEMANGDQYLSTEIAAVDKDNDLALVRIDARNLPVMEFASSSEPAIGSLLATSGLEELPVAIGVYGLGPHEIAMKNAMLGVMLSREPGPAKVDMVVEKSAAALAGIVAEDVILAVNDTEVTSSDQLIQTVRTYKPGDSLRVKLKRDDKEMSLSVILGEWVAGPGQARHEFQNHLGGELSTRRSGFPAVFQHDSYLQPEQCGGPIVNLDGEVVGLNIARAGRVATYAIPGDTLVAAVGKLLSAAGATSDAQLVNSRVSAKPVVSDSSEEIQPASAVEESQEARWVPRATAN